jgi:hypothetical protein
MVDMLSNYQVPMEALIDKGLRKLCQLTLFYQLNQRAAFWMWATGAYQCTQVAQMLAQTA